MSKTKNIISRIKKVTDRNRYMGGVAGYALCNYLILLCGKKA